MSQFSKYPVTNGGSGVTSINGNSTAAQVIAGGSGITVNSASGTTTISQSNAEFNAGNSGTSKTIDFNNGPAQLLTLTGNVTLTLSNATAGGAYLLRLATGAGSFTVTWPGAVKWPNSTAPVITTAASKVDLINLYSDGTNFYGSYSQNY